jgi:hypothetical protein
VVGSSSKRAFSDALTEAGVDVKSATAELKQDLGRAIGELLANAQRAGTVRRDVGVPELMALLGGAFHAAERGTACSETVCRVLDIIFNGLRVAGAKGKRPQRKTHPSRG